MKVHIVRQEGLVAGFKGFILFCGLAVFLMIWATAYGDPQASRAGLIGASIAVSLIIVRYVRVSLAHPK
jgi:hypothetical protein